MQFLFFFPNILNENLQNLEREKKPSLFLWIVTRLIGLLEWILSSLTFPSLLGRAVVRFPDLCSFFPNKKCKFWGRTHPPKIGAILMKFVWIAPVDIQLHAFSTDEGFLFANRDFQIWRRKHTWFFNFLRWMLSSQNSYLFLAIKTISLFLCIGKDKTFYLSYICIFNLCKCCSCIFCHLLPR